MLLKRRDQNSRSVYIYSQTPTITGVNRHWNNHGGDLSESCRVSCSMKNTVTHFSWLCLRSQSCKTYGTDVDTLWSLSTPEVGIHGGVCMRIAPINVGECGHVDRRSVQYGWRCIEQRFLPLEFHVHFNIGHETCQLPAWQPPRSLPMSIAVIASSFTACYHRYFVAAALRTNIDTINSSFVPVIVFQYYRRLRMYGLANLTSGVWSRGTQ